MKSVRRFLPLIFVAIFFIVSGFHCLLSPTAPLSCGDFDLRVPVGTCVLFDNPCQGGQWSNTDGFDFDPQARPPKIWVQTNRAAGVPTTREICAAPGANIINETFAFFYQSQGRLGTGSVRLSTAPMLSVSASATPSTIDFGASSQLLASVSGGVSPYTYNWFPSSGLNQTDISTPKASPNVGTIYTVSVFDASGQTASATVRVSVRSQLAVTASPPAIDAGEVSQLTANGGGGQPPYTFSWLPVTALDDPTIANPIARPANTRTYTVTMIDSDGVTLTGSVRVKVNLIPTGISASPSTVNPGQASALHAELTGGMLPLSYHWTPANTIIAGQGTPDVVVQPAATTAYTVNVVDADGFSVSANVTVSVNLPNPAPMADFTFLRSGSTIIFNGQGDSDGDGFGTTGNIVSYAWHIVTSAGIVHDGVCPSADPQCDSANPAIFNFVAGIEGSALRGTATLTVTAADGQTASLTRSYR